VADACGRRPRRADRITGAGGALEAAARVRDEGIIGAVGITGHGDGAAATHLEGLRRHPFATVLTPLNPVLWRDESYRANHTGLAMSFRSRGAAANHRLRYGGAGVDGSSRASTSGIMSARSNRRGDASHRNLRRTLALD
jgi:hypothetical protein